MTKTRIHPRPEQVAELTRGISLPLPPIPESILRLVAETLTQVWRELIDRRQEVVCSGDEAEVSALLEGRLNTLRDEDPLWETIVSGASRGRESVNFDGSRLEKRPDLSIHLTNRCFNFPLVVECKLIDAARNKTVGLYCSQGLVRFVRGEYAWMSREAFMLGYVRDGCNIAGCLHPHLAKPGPREKYATETLPAPLSGVSCDLAHTAHRRDFAYLEPMSRLAPGPIEVWHLWLSTRI